MPYKPNYCSHCGEKVERAVWRPWTSSRFCENCEVAFKQIDWLPKIGLAVAGIGGLFGFGSYLNAPENNPVVAKNQFTISTANKPQAVKNEQVAVNSNVQNLNIKPTVKVTVAPQNQTKAEFLQKTAPPPIQAENPQITESEPVYFCGAQTKKRTPCTRKVKGSGRCWQHAGLAAMLPKEKLAAEQ